MVGTRIVREEEKGGKENEVKQLSMEKRGKGGGKQGG